MAKPQRRHDEISNDDWNRVKSLHWLRENVERPHGTLKGQLNAVAEQERQRTHRYSLDSHLRLLGIRNADSVIRIDSEEWYNLAPMPIMDSKTLQWRFTVPIPEHSLIRTTMDKTCEIHGRWAHQQVRGPKQNLGAAHVMLVLHSQNIAKM